jgi:flagellar hook-length control protein FliK
MNNTPIDYVLSVQSPRSEAAFAPLRPRDDAPRFDSHFRKESEAREPSSQPPSRPPEAPARREQSVTDRPVQQTNEVAPPADDDRHDDEQETDEAASATPSDAQPTPVVAALSVEQVVAEEAAALADVPQDQPVVADGKPGLAAKEAPELNAKPPSSQPGSDAQQETAPIEGSIDLESAVSPGSATKIAVASAVEEVAVPATDQSQAVPTEQTAAEAAPTDEPGSETRAEAKSNKNTGDRTAPAPTNAGDDERLQVRATAPDQAVEIAAAVPRENLESAAAATDKTSAAQRDEKQAEPKATTANADDPSPGRPAVAVAAASRAAALNPAVPAVANIAANVDPSQLAVDTSPDAPESDLKTQQIQPTAKESLLSPFARLERGGPLNAHANRASGERTSATNIDPARFVSRVARAVQTAHERGAPLQLRLSPPELGTMRLELTVRGGALSASIETDNSQARQLLLDNLPALRDRLAEQNVRIERFDVDVRRDGTGDGSGGRPNTGPQEQGHNQQRHSAPQRTNTGRGATNQTTNDTPPPVRRTITNTSINVIA